jgi:hypothetical protein
LIFRDFHYASAIRPLSELLATYADMSY